MAPPCKSWHTPVGRCQKLTGGCKKNFGSLRSPASTPLTKTLKPPLPECLNTKIAQQLLDYKITFVMSFTIAKWLKKYYYVWLIWGNFKWVKWTNTLVPIKKTRCIFLIRKTNFYKLLKVIGIKKIYFILFPFRFGLHAAMKWVKWWFKSGIFLFDCYFIWLLLKHL